MLRAGHYWVPHYYKASYGIAYWNKFSRPAVQPKYDAGILDTWWYDPVKAAALKLRQADGAISRTTGEALMAVYLLKRVLLVIPTLFGIMLFSFIIIQFAPGGPVERMIAELMGQSSSIVSRMGGGGGDTMGGGAMQQSARRRRR